MRSTIDAGGRVVIPKVLREKLGLVAGASVEITERDGSVEIAPAATPMTLRGAEPVAIAEQTMPSLSAEQVRDVVESIRR
jgi:AbrB family looped-hinge helix DNA binding protein